jgi:hypothetical protein
MDRALVLSADYWEMPDEKTGEVIKGWSCWYVNDYREDSKHSMGCKPTRITLSEKLVEKLRGVELPALCDIGFGSRPGQAGKAQLTLTTLEVVRPFSLND